MELIKTDGGRHRAGYSSWSKARDCGVRAVCIATGSTDDYAGVYKELSRLEGKSARLGLNRKALDSYLQDRGWTWTPTMRVGQGCKVHMREDELPGGAIIVRLSRHFAAVIDGVLHDTHDCSRDGTRCVYGYWSLQDKV